MKSIVQAGRVVVVLCVVALDWKWRDWRGAQDEESAVFQVVTELEIWDSTRDPTARDKLREQIEDRMKDLRDPADLARALPARFFDTFVATQSFDAWWDTDSGGVLAWMAIQPNPPRFQLARFLHELSGDYENAGRYVGSLPAGPWKDRVLETLSREDILASKPQEALALLPQMRAGETRTALLKSALMEWSERDFDGAVHWLDQVRDDELRRSLLEPVALGRSSSDPNAALSWLIRRDEPVEIVAPVVRSIMGRFAEHSSLDAVASAAQLPDGVLRDAALEGLIQSWIRIDPGALAEWIAGLPQEDLGIRANRIYQSAVDNENGPSATPPHRRVSSP